MATEEEITRQLTALAGARLDDQHATVSALTVLPGHAGQSYSFKLERPGERAQKLVLRLAPEGVRNVGTADVVRQAKVMESLAGTRVPVPAIKWMDDDPRWFGRPFFVADFLEGDKLALGENSYNADESSHYTRLAAETLAALHAIEWQTRRVVWGDPFTLSDELARLDNLLDRPTLDLKVVARAPELRERLRATLAPAPRIGCVHGDYQWSNFLFHDGHLAAVIDWELSQIGAVLLDLGWLCVFSDKDSWVGTQLVPEHAPEPDEIADIYRKAVSYPVASADLRWFRAFASYRFGVITVFNLMLHRRGKRFDPTWEDIAVSAPRLFERGLELIA
ncbi:MAG: phosphotransferase family protein [Candidatus Binataceae bacterium]